MKKTLCALAIGATILTPVMASAADVKIYGRAHVSLDYLDDGKDYNEVGLSSNSSRLGFKVDQKINDDINLDNSISIVADAYAHANVGVMKYIVWNNTPWKIQSFSINRPRIVIQIGGIYNGERPIESP